MEKKMHKTILLGIDRDYYEDLFLRSLLTSGR